MLIGHSGCAHLGYFPRNPRTVTIDGNTLPIREHDGHVAHRLIVDGMIAAGVGLALDGGDLFHTPSPTVATLDVAMAHDRLLRDAGIDTFYNTGNHDAAVVARRLTPTALMGAADGNCVCTGVATGRGPAEGRYEILEFADVAYHVVSHQGLSITSRESDPFEIAPVSGKTNILVSHGAFEADNRIYGAAEPHGDEYPIPTEWAEPMDLMVLSHFHQMGKVEWAGGCPVWWTGSSLRRGFADPQNDRGWLLVDTDGATPTVTEHPIWQRPQYEMDTVNADGMSPTEVVAAIQDNLMNVVWEDDASLELTGHGGPIVRQQVWGLDQAGRQYLDAHRKVLDDYAEGAAEWILRMESRQSQTSGVDAAMRTAVRALETPLARFDHMADQLGIGIDADVRAPAMVGARATLATGTEGKR